MQSFISNRTQRREIGSGVLQESVPGPLLFNIFKNDLFYVKLESEICNFADITAIYARDTPLDSVMTELGCTPSNTLSVV